MAPAGSGEEGRRGAPADLARRGGYGGRAWASGPAAVAMWSVPRGGTALAEAGGGVERTLSGAVRTRPSAADLARRCFFLKLGFETRGSGIWRRGSINRHKWS